MPSTESGRDRSHPRPILSKPQEELIIDATRNGLLQDVPEQVGRAHREKLGIFGAPGIRALTYVLVDGDSWPKTSEFRDYITFQGPDSDGRIDVRPFGKPASVAWRPDAGETDASVQLDLHQYNPGSETQFLATTADSDEDLPHIVFGWHEVPKPGEQGEGKQ